VNLELHCKLLDAYLSHKNHISSFSCLALNVCLMVLFKGQCHEIFYSGFFIKQLVIVPLNTSGKDFKFFRIFEELFVFVVDLPVYSPPGSRNSPLYSSLWSRDSPVMNTPGGQPKLGSLHKTCWCKIHQGVRLHCDEYTGRSLLPELFVTRKSFANLFYCLFQIHKDVDSRCIHHRGFETPRCFHHMRVETPRCFHHWGVILATRESFY
jgi:hypothetical protein